MAIVKATKNGAEANMNGAEAVVATLVAAGVDTCFANPGTSEMHFVAALDQVPGLRPVLGLFEGVVTGAADGYARMAGKPAVTLLHLGPGLGNGLANLHNARRAHSPIVNIIGDHAIFHRQHDAPLASDIAGIAGPVSAWVRTSESIEQVATDARDAVAAACAYPGQIATLMLPADLAWTAGAVAAKPIAAPAPDMPGTDTIDSLARILSSGGDETILYLAGAGVNGRGLQAAGRIQAATGCKLMCPTFNGRIERGAGRPLVEKIPYFADMAKASMQGAGHLILAGAAAPVSFFGYPGQDSWLTPEGCAVDLLARFDEDIAGALEALAEALDAPSAPDYSAKTFKPGLPKGELTPATIGASLGLLLPEGAIISDEAITSGLALGPLTAGAPPHDWLEVTGGSIGQGLPVATGAAIACPDRKIISLEGDGSAMYTIQSLWTQARENLDVLTIIFANSTYSILTIEHVRVGAGAPGRNAQEMLSIGNPELDFVRMAEAMGVEAARAETAEVFHDLLATAMKRRGPFLIEAKIAPIKFG